MAVVQNFNPDDPQNNQQQQQGNQAPAQPVSLAGGSSTFTGNTGTAAAPTIKDSNSATKSGSYTNLKNYIDANKNYNQQGGGFGGQIYSDLDNKQQGIQTNFAGAQTNFNNQANQGRVQYDQNVINQAFADPTQYANNQANLNAFAKLRDATYAGPTQLAQGQDFQNQASQFQGLTNQTQSEQGRYGLLNNLYGDQKYNQGQQQLDNLFLQADPSQLAKLQSSTQLGKNLTGNINQGLAADQTLAQGYQQEANATKNATQQALSNQILGFNQQAQNQANAYNDQATRQYNDLRDQLSHGQMPTNLMQSLGLGGVSDLYGIDPTQFLQKNNYNATALNSITGDQYNKISALSKLAGGQLGGQANDILGSFTSNPNQVGQAATDKAYEFNANQFLGAVNQNKQNYTNEVSAANSNLANQIANLDHLTAVNNGRSSINSGLDPSGAYSTPQAQLDQQRAQSQNAYAAALANLKQKYAIGGALTGI